MKKLLLSLEDKHITMLDAVIKRNYPKIRNYTDAIKSLIEYNDSAPEKRVQK